VFLPLDLRYLGHLRMNHLRFLNDGTRSLERTPSSSGNRRLCWRIGKVTEVSHP